MEADEPEGVDLLELLKAERDFVQWTLMSVVVTKDGDKDYNAAINTLLAMYEATRTPDPDDLTLLGRAVESVLCRMEYELFGDVLDND